MVAWGAEADDWAMRSAGGTDGSSGLGGGLALRPAEIGAAHSVAKVEVTLFAGVAGSGGGIEGGIEFNTDLFARGGVARLAARLAVLAGGLAGSADASAWSARMTPEAEAARVLWRFNDTGAAWPTEACVHELVGAQAARTPAGVALEWAGSTLTLSLIHI